MKKIEVYVASWQPIDDITFQEQLSRWLVDKYECSAEVISFVTLSIIELMPTKDICTKFQITQFPFIVFNENDHEHTSTLRELNEELYELFCTIHTTRIDITSEFENAMAAYEGFNLPEAISR